MMLSQYKSTKKSLYKEMDKILPNLTSWFYNEACETRHFYLIYSYYSNFHIIEKLYHFWTPFPCHASQKLLENNGIHSSSSRSADLLHCGGHTGSGWVGHGDIPDNTMIAGKDRVVSLLTHLHCIINERVSSLWQGLDPLRSHAIQLLWEIKGLICVVDKEDEFP